MGFNYRLPSGVVSTVAGFTVNLWPASPKNLFREHTLGLVELGVDGKEPLLCHGNEQGTKKLDLLCVPKATLQLELPSLFRDLSEFGYRRANLLEFLSLAVQRTKALAEILKTSPYIASGHLEDEGVIPKGNELVLTENRGKLDLRVFPLCPHDEVNALVVAVRPA